MILGWKVVDENYDADKGEGSGVIFVTREPADKIKVVGRARMSTIRLALTLGDGLEMHRQAVLNMMHSAVADLRFRIGSPSEGMVGSPAAGE